MKNTDIELGRQQQGAALLVALIMLVLISMLAAAGFFMSTGEARGAAGWGDRQRAMFAAEGALKEASESVESFVAANAVNVEAAVGSQKGYYKRHDGDLPDVSDASHWTADNSIKATAVDSRADNISYMVVYEGTAPQAGQGFLQSNGNVNKTSTRPRFTIYAKAGGIKDGTYVVLSTSKEF